jgi:hypothetical protein
MRQRQMKIQITKNSYTLMSDYEYISLYYSLKHNSRSELKKMLFEFGITLKSQCKKDDYIRELIQCLDDMYNDNEEPDLLFN